MFHYDESGFTVVFNGVKLAQAPFAPSHHPNLDPWIIAYGTLSDFRKRVTNPAHAHLRMAFHRMSHIESCDICGQKLAALSKALKTDQAVAEAEIDQYEAGFRTLLDAEPTLSMVLLHAMVTGDDDYWDKIKDPAARSKILTAASIHLTRYMLYRPFVELGIVANLEHED